MVDNVGGCECPVCKGMKLLGENHSVVNEDKEIWRKIKSDYYSPSIFVTKRGWIGINVGGYVFEKPIENWHRMAKEAEQPQPCEYSECPSDCTHKDETGCDSK